VRKGLRPDTDPRRGPRTCGPQRCAQRQAVLAVALLLAAAAPASAGLKLVATEQLRPRLQELTFRTDALKADTHVRILRPAGFDPLRRYPVLYLLHGCCDDYRSWADKGDVEAIVGDRPLIVVMPDGGQGGFYSDWYNGGAYGPPQWERYHVGQLVPWIDANLPVVARRHGRAIVGLSMGGFGAMSYAARHPALFIAAASFSGAVNTMDAGGQSVEPISMQDGGRPGDIWGLRAVQETRWRAHNPTDLAANLRGMHLEVRTGNGLPGGPYGGGPDLLEIGVHAMSTEFDQALDGLHIAHVFQDYGPGAHTWPYWQRDLQLTLPALMAAFAGGDHIPAKVTFTTAERRYRAFGWRVAVARPEELAFTTLRDASRHGFIVSGNPKAKTTVLTARLFRAGARYRVRVGSTARTLRARPDRRLRIVAPLGVAVSINPVSWLLRK
jgi:S-formylglutathione hydrolase FrmB